MATKEFFKSIENKNIHIVGLSGAEGSAVALFLANGGAKNITAHDFSKDPEELKINFWKTHLNLPRLARENEFKKLLALPLKINYQDKYLNDILAADIIFVPSSWYLYKFNFPLLKEAEKKGILLKGITNLYYELAPCPIIAVTGTKGKGTTSKLIFEILKKASDSKDAGKAYYGGNDRYSGQALNDLLKMDKNDVLVLETSNRQLALNFQKSPHIGVVTNITPDHLEEHGGFDGYIKIKRKLIEHQKKGDYSVLNYDNEITRRFAEEFPETSFLFSRKTALKEGAFIKNGRIFIKHKGKEAEICALSNIKILGKHNIENVLAAASAAYLFGVNPETIKETIDAFGGLKHRIEFIGEYQGMKFYDDLASTTPESTIAAIETLQGLRIKNKEPRIILIAGGDTKGGNYAELAKVITDKIDMLFLLPGTGTEAIKLQITNYHREAGFRTRNKLQNNPKFQILNGNQANAITKECNNFSEVRTAIKQQTKTGDIVLISPACAHFQSKYIDNTKKSLKKLLMENFT